jgi:hypothetical protein
LIAVQQWAEEQRGAGQRRLVLQQDHAWQRGGSFTSAE